MAEARVSPPTSATDRRALGQLLLFVPPLLAMPLGLLDVALAALGWWLLQPLFALAALYALGQRLSWTAPPTRRAAGQFALLYLGLSAALLLLGLPPGWRLLAEGSLAWALLLGLGLSLAWLLLWSRWPLLFAVWLPAMGRLAPASRLKLLGMSRYLAGAVGRAAGAEPGDDLPYSGLFQAALTLLLLAVAPLLLVFTEGVLPWLAGGLLAICIYALQFALVIRARRRQLQPPPVSVIPAAGEEDPVIASGNPTLALYAALRLGRGDMALAQIAAGADVHQPPDMADRDQRTLLMLAALLSDLRPLRGLIARGADVNLVHGGLTALLAATRDSFQGRVEAVMTLLANGADPRLADAEGNTPLHHAARSSDPGVAALLLDAGANVEQENRAGQGPLASACACGNWRLARFLLEHGASAQGNAGHPPLLAAAAGDDDPAGVQLLLKHKAKVNQCGRFDRRALHAAALVDNVEVVKALLQAGADVDARDERGVTALHEAARAGADGVIASLAAAGAAPDICDEAGCNALNIACRSRRSSVATLRALLAMGVDPEHLGSDGKTPLQQVLATGRWALVATLDPSYQLPASVVLDDEDAEAVLPNGKRLLQLLLAGRFHDAQALLDRQAPVSDELHSLALELALAVDGESAGREALRWLWRRGLLDNTQSADHDSFGFSLLDAGATAANALLALLEAGLQVSGAGGLSRYLQATVVAEQASRGCENLALLLLDHGVDPFGVHDDGDPALVLALRQGWLRLAERLLLAGVHPDLRDRDGATSLQVACRIGLEPAVRLLVRFGADADARSPDGQTAQGMALAAGRRDLSRWFGWTSWQRPRRALRAADLCSAAAVGDRDAVERLLDLQLPIDAVDAQGCSALLRASGSGHVTVVDALLDRGASPAQPSRSGATALSAAISMGHGEIVRTLLQRGARVDQTLPGGVTPLMIAAALGNAAIVNQLLVAGAAADRTDEIGNNALLAAAQFIAARGRSAAGAALLQRLLQVVSDADATNQAGHTALLLLLGARQDAGARMDEECVLESLERLLARGVDLSAQDRRGYGPLHLAALHGLNRVVSRLLSAGARPALRDSLGRSAHDIAVMRGFVDIAQQFEPRAQPSLARYLRPKPE